MSEEDVRENARSRNDSMKFWWLIFVLLLGQCGVLVCAVLQDARTDRTGAERANAAHPEHAAMARGGSVADRNADLLVAGWAFGGLQIVLLVALLTRGIKGTRGKAAAGRRLVFAGLAVPHMAVFTAVILLYRQELTAADPQLMFSLPRSTLVMLSILWPLPLVFVVLYTVLFRRWVYDSPTEKA